MCPSAGEGDAARIDPVTSSEAEAGCVSRNPGPSENPRCQKTQTWKVSRTLDPYSEIVKVSLSLLRLAATPMTTRSARPTTNSTVLDVAAHGYSRYNQTRSRQTPWS
jgi:hypothetical protein